MILGTVTGGLPSTKIKNAIITLEAANWTNGIYDLNSIYPGTKYNIEISLDSQASNEQYNAYSKAQMVGASSTNQIKCFGTVPTIDIPVLAIYYEYTNGGNA